jgi:hypothetical protein
MKGVLVSALSLCVVVGCSGDAPAEQEAADEAPAPAAPSLSRPLATTPTTEIPTPPPPAAAPVPRVDPAELATVHRYTQMFYDGQLDLLHQEFSDEMRQVVPLEQLSSIHEYAITNYGMETRIISEDTQEKDGVRGFVRWARFDKTDEIIEIQWMLKANDEIAGFFIRPAKKQVREEAPLSFQP